MAVRHRSPSSEDESATTSPVRLPSRSYIMILLKQGRKPTWEVIEEIETKALIARGAKADEALEAVKRIIQVLKDRGVTGPTTIPSGR